MGSFEVFLEEEAWSRALRSDRVSSGSWNEVSVY